MRITFLSQRQLAVAVTLFVSTLVEILLMKVVPENLTTIVFLVSALILFWFSVEVSQNYITDPIIFDFRSKKVKETEERDRAKTLIEGLRNNLLMQVANNEISAEKAIALFSNVKKFEEETDPGFPEKQKALEFKQQLHQKLEITNERI